MPRIFGVDIPREKRTDDALRYLDGIGPTLSAKILKEAAIDPAKRAKDLTDKEVAQITSAIQKSNMKVEGDLRREVQQNIKRLIDIKSYKGSRHIKGLPVRGPASEPTIQLH
jgi:small subunit ribosomal protein S13